MLGNADPITVNVMQPVDWVGSVVVPVAAVLVSAAIAVWIASAERRSARRARAHEGAASLIRALNELGRAAMLEPPAEAAAAVAVLLELNVFTTLLAGRNVVVAKWVCVVLDKPTLDVSGAVRSRHAMWIASAIEAWVRGEFRTRDFARNMPDDTSNWVETTRLDDWAASARGEDVLGMPSIPRSDR